MPVPVRGRGRAPEGVWRCRSVGGAPGGRTPEESELDVVRTRVPLMGVRRPDIDCGFESVRARCWMLAALTIDRFVVDVAYVSCENERVGCLRPVTGACGRRSGRGTCELDDDGTEVEDEPWE